MGEHKRQARRVAMHWRAAWNRAGYGALVGLVLAGMALVFGLARAVIVLLTGRHIGTDGMARGLAYYAIGLGIAGALVAAAWPIRRSSLGRFTLGIGGAAVAFAFIIASGSGPMGDWRAAEYQELAILATVFGLPLGYQFGKR